MPVVFAAVPAILIAINSQLQRCHANNLFWEVVLGRHCAFRFLSMQTVSRLEDNDQKQLCAWENMMSNAEIECHVSREVTVFSANL